MKGRTREPSAKTAKVVSWLAVVVMALGLSGVAMGCSSDVKETGQTDVNASSDGKIGEVPDEEWAAYEPERVTLEDGRVIQQTPYGAGGYMSVGYSYSTDWKYYNTYMLDADNRGCSSCHDLGDVLMARVNDGRHAVFRTLYGADEVPLQSCYGCHAPYGVTLQNVGHAHMNFDSFNEMGGSCNSCHYVDGEGNYLMWDFVKNDLFSGIIKQDAATVDVSLTWNQDEITDADHMFTKLMAFLDYDNGIVEHSDDIRDTWTVTFTGEGIDEPITMSIQDMIDKYGTETRVQAAQCTINGTGGGLIYQVEVTGVPFSKMVDDLGLNDKGIVCDVTGADGYSEPVTVERLLELDALFVYEINGEEIDDERGYPVAMYLKGISHANDVRYLSELNFSAEGLAAPAAGNGYHQGVAGDYVYATLHDSGLQGASINTPNIGVLTVANGQVFEAGKPVHLEGYAHAFDETVTKMEFSFDGGLTWVQVGTPGTDNTRWIYWKMDVNSWSEPGAYVLKMRVTSVDENGEEHTNA